MPLLTLPGVEANVPHNGSYTPQANVLLGTSKYTLNLAGSARINAPVGFGDTTLFVVRLHFSALPTAEITWDPVYYMTEEQVLRGQNGGVCCWLFMYENGIAWPMFRFGS